MLSKHQLTDKDLLSVQRPAQYLGGEWGSIYKNDSDVKLHLCLAFPDNYEVGMSHIGYQILYQLINKDHESYAERVYAPEADMETLLREKALPLCSLETKRPLARFDVIGFSLQYELCMNGILSILDLGQIPLTAKERDDNMPLIIGGGPVAYHPEPYADFFDAFLIGDGEELVLEFNQAIKVAKQKKLSRQATLEKISQIQGIYVPSFFSAEYDTQNQFKQLVPLISEHKIVTRRILADLDQSPYPEHLIIPNVKSIHDRLSVEVMRGCVRGCRFCQAGYLYRPHRERNPLKVKETVNEALGNTGYEELSLLSLSTADYCSIIPLLRALKSEFALNDQLALSLPSTRVDALKKSLLEEIQTIRRSGFTIAPEAGTQRLRDVINKGVCDEEIMQTCKNVLDLGWNRLKLYFMIGLPTETDEDLDGIIEIASKVKRLAGLRRPVSISVSTFVPKPHTPFQWCEQISIAEVKRRQALLFEGCKKARVGFRSHDAEASFLEGVFARGDRKLGQVILKAYQKGCRFDAWSEKLDFDLWQTAFDDAEIDATAYMSSRAYDQALPWDHISCGISKEFFNQEWQSALAAKVLPDCLNHKCSGCGICDFKSVANLSYSQEFSTPELSPKTRPISQATKEDACKLRCRYKKAGIYRFISHLELMATFFRAARRAALPLAYSKGFSPKPKMAFGPPLPLGVLSDCEYVDFLLTQVVNPKAFIERFNKNLPDGLSLASAKLIDKKTPAIQAIIKEQTYEAKLNDSFQISPGKLAEALDKISEWKDKSATRIRKGKKQEIALKDCVEKISVTNESINLSIANNPQSPSLKPVEILEASTELSPDAFVVKKIGVEFK